MDKPALVLYAAIFWGNQKGGGGITDVFELKIDRERGGWFNDDMQASIMFDGTRKFLKTFAEGSQHSGYISPNQHDVSVFIAGYIQAMAVTNPVSEHPKDVLHGVIIFFDKAEGVPKPYSLKCHQDEDGTFVDAASGMRFSAAGRFSLTHTKEAGIRSEVFLSHDPNENFLVSTGIQMLQDILGE